MRLTADDARVTTTDLWKLAGLVFVLLDHWGLYFDPDQDAWRVVGRLAAPVFFFFIGFARSRGVPWTWIVFGLVLTLSETWTSGDGLELNILLNFALVRLLLPEVERRIMPHPARVALLALAIVLLIRPVAPVLEYGAEGWLWALFGLAHRRALDGEGSARQRNLLGAGVALVYAVTEILDYGFKVGGAVVLALLVGALATLLTRFRREALAGRPPRPVAVPLRFAGRRSLEIYAVSLFAMQVIAYAWEEPSDDAGEDDDEAA